jgi:hypothetical protein
VYKQIATQKLSLPFQAKVSRPFLKLILNLLDKNPGKRKGGPIGNLKDNTWFSETNWDDMLIKQVYPPYLPNGVVGSHKA